MGLQQAAALSYNLLLLAADLLLLAALRRRPSERLLCWGLLGGGVLVVVLAVPLGAGAFGMLGLLAQGLFGHGILVLLGAWRVLRRERPRTARGCALLALLLGAIAVDAFLVEPRWLEVTRLRIDSPAVPRPLRIVVLADLQTDRVGDYECRVLQQAMAERADLILLPGDYLQVEQADWPAQRERLNRLLREVQLSAPLGVFAVQGNVDPRDWPRIFDGLPVTPIAQGSTRKLLPGLWLTGLGLRESFDPRLHVPRREGFHIVFGHAPDFALGRVEADLLVAGHTHGGQVRLPGFGPPLYLSRVPRAWAAGRTELPGGRTLVVSRGIGMERAGAPRLRFLCRPELVVIEVSPER